MTIQRQYQLPNCSLILDGLSIDSTPGSEEIMSLLVNAECRISGLERSLNGGYNFFSALVRAVSQYSQEVLSGFAHPQVAEDEPLLVHINPGEGPYHHLVIQPEVADLGGASDGRAIDIKLSAVQLFDLSEAVDQFFDDSQTLPELAPALAPLPRRFVRADEPLSDRLLPAVLGVGSLVAATLALGLLPVPKLQDPNTALIETDNTAEVVTSTPDPENTEPAVPENIMAVNASSPLWENSPRIKDEAQLASLQTELQNKLELNAEPAGTFKQPASYQVAVNADGEVLGYKFNDDIAAKNVDKTPLPRLARDNADKAELETQAIAQYDATFDADGVAVTPWQDGTQIATKIESGSETETEDPDATQSETAIGSPDTTSDTFSSGPPTTLTQFTEVEALNSQLKQTIVENRKQPRVGADAASYRVRISQDGTITGYQPINPEAAKAVEETPLPKLVKSTSEDVPSVDYRVVFTERGVIEVSPWWGWSYYD
ncbi:MAG: hypothetical protein DCF25_09065 [Leptolyngbya foveolarum]|uniref:DUF4335 domain-containing protein n=1 Tax=Leptolyngbya foveolarum TaxID=47253 RepID=A0A2W4UPM2_9CYAN|nr:MAG: hypothetical protein DCF25_09065 [Leptolyngbya foveolarum]